MALVALAAPVALLVVLAAPVALLVVLAAPVALVVLVSAALVLPVGPKKCSEFGENCDEGELLTRDPFWQGKWVWSQSGAERHSGDTG
mgnify:CR=1 FL=1